MRGCGRIERPAFPAPSDLQMAHQSKTRVLMRGEIANAWLQTTALLQRRLGCNEALAANEAATRHKTTLRPAISTGGRRSNENVGWPMQADLGMLSERSARQKASPQRRCISGGDFASSPL